MNYKISIDVKLSWGIEEMVKWGNCWALTEEKRQQKQILHISSVSRHQCSLAPTRRCVLGGQGVGVWVCGVCVGVCVHCSSPVSQTQKFKNYLLKIYRVWYKTLHKSHMHYYFEILINMWLYQGADITVWIIFTKNLKIYFGWY